MFKYCSTYRNESRQDPRAKTCPTPIKATNRVKDPRAKTYQLYKKRKDFASIVFHQYFTSISPIFHCISPVFHQYFTRIYLLKKSSGKKKKSGVLERCEQWFMKKWIIALNH
ncbi:unnamed protein product [Rhizophagus irregularis]|nr:unnamed protein product [Rhizophagus irregularis]